MLALAAHREDGHPDNCAATGRMLGVDRDTVRAWRQRLLAEGLVELRGGYVVATDKGRELLRAGCDPLPRALLRGRGKRPSPALLRACAIVYADAIGWRAARRGCRSDGERALLAGVSRRYVVAARLLLADRDLIGVEALRRGRADLRRARLTEDRRATHGRPIGDDLADRLAIAAARGRRGAERRNSKGAERWNTPMQSLRGTGPMQAPSAPAADGCRIVASLPMVAERGGTASTPNRPHPHPQGEPRARAEGPTLHEGRRCRRSRSCSRARLQSNAQARSGSSGSLGLAARSAVSMAANASASATASPCTLCAGEQHSYTASFAHRSGNAASQCAAPASTATARRDSTNS